MDNAQDKFLNIIIIILLLLLLIIIIIIFISLFIYLQHTRVDIACSCEFVLF